MMRNFLRKNWLFIAATVVMVAYFIGYKEVHKHVTAEGLAYILVFFLLLFMLGGLASVNQRAKGAVLILVGAPLFSFCAVINGAILFLVPAPTDAPMIDVAMAQSIYAICGIGSAAAAIMFMRSGWQLLTSSAVR
jgi:hypothetical protein